MNTLLYLLSFPILILISCSSYDSIGSVLEEDNSGMISELSKHIFDHLEPVGMKSLEWSFTIVSQYSEVKLYETK